MTTPSSSMTSAELGRATNLIEVKPGLKFSMASLKTMLPDVETALFFGKVYGLDAQQLGQLLLNVFRTDLTTALFGDGGSHSHDLQDYIVDLLDFVPEFERGEVKFDDAVEPKGAILPEVWKALEVEVATSIKAVAEKLESTIGLMAGKQGEMVFRTMAKLNARRPTIGVHNAAIHHAPQKQNLVILDVSGSVDEPTIKAIIEDVVALGYMANAHMAIVSNTCSYWEPGQYSVETILARCEYGGTRYEQLVPLFDRDWGTVVTIADYDSSHGAKQALAECTGHIDELLDISIVGQPTFLAKCVGQLASAVRPLLVASDEVGQLGAREQYQY